MNLQQLEYALTLEKLGSFTRAAQSLNMTQPALSLQIKNLENEIGISLFDRSRARIEPTEQGLKFLLKAGEIVRASKQLKEYAITLGSQFGGELKLGIIPTLSPYLVPLFLDSLLDQYPELSLEIHELLTEDILHKIRLGDLDGGIISTPISRQGITVKPLFYESFYMYNNLEQIDQAKSLKVSNLDLKNLWLLEEGNCFRDQVSDICSLKNVKSNSHISYHCSSIDSLLRMVDNQGGSTILPELTTLSLDSDQEQNLILLEDKVREVGFVTRKLTGKEHLFEILTKKIKASVPAPMREKSGREVVDPGILEDWK
ncbi:LysR substrate-binding domain-containing protein [Ekhidna sp. To15]|uniref:LysR substrate-binding domain-containing protein n=1 Tax=Ekhidna sp. To15 TaxID=3395267 RepID=UPI003F5227AB